MNYEKLEEIFESAIGKLAAYQPAVAAELRAAWRQEMGSKPVREHQSKPLSSVLAGPPESKLSGATTGHVNLETSAERRGGMDSDAFKAEE